MAKITCTRISNADIIHLDGDLDAEAIQELDQTISMLRNQGSNDLLWIGSGLGRVYPQELTRLTRPMKVYRQLGGRIVLAAFSESALQIIQRAPWHRYLNVFHDEGEARSFLSISPAAPLEPVIAPDEDDEEITKPGPLDESDVEPAPDESDTENESADDEGSDVDD